MEAPFSWHGFEWYGHPNCFYANGVMVPCVNAAIHEDPGNPNFFWCAVPLGETPVVIWLYLHQELEGREDWMMLQTINEDRQLNVKNNRIVAIDSYKLPTPEGRLLSVIFDEYRHDVVDATDFLEQWTYLRSLPIDLDGQSTNR